MDLLVLGGTVFLGLHVVEEALARGHRVTIFNRGESNPGLFPQVEKLVGNRDGHLEALMERQWDAVIDTSGYVPRTVNDSAALLAPAINHYTFISSISVYDETAASSINENSPIRKMVDESDEEITGETYGALKALCERELEMAMPGRSLQVRSGLIVGPNDPSDRFTYWPWRLAQGGSILAPEGTETPVQIIDVRDLAGWLVESAEQERTGVYNVTGPQRPISLKTVIEKIHDVVESSGDLIWVDDGFLLAEEVGQWLELPLWLADEESKAIMKVNIEKALAAGLSFRPIEQTIADTLSWAQGRPKDHEWRSGLSLERERELIKKWKKSN